MNRRTRLSNARKLRCFVFINQLDQKTRCCPIPCFRFVFSLFCAALTGWSCKAIFAMRNRQPCAKPLVVFFFLALDSTMCLCASVRDRAKDARPSANACCCWVGEDVDPCRGPLLIVSSRCVRPGSLNRVDH